MSISYSKHGFNNLTYARLSEYTNSSATALRLIHGYVANLLQGWASGRNLYVTITDAQANLEICKVTAINFNTLTVERGQDGTVARNWPAGSLISQRLVSTNLGRIHQKGEYRTIGFNPNGVLAGLYPGEKVYETGSDACQKRWWLFNEATKWRLLAGEKCAWEYYDDDGYILEPGFWEPWDAEICTYNNWDYIMFWDHTASPVSESCNISMPPFPAGLWDLSSGGMKHDWTNNLTTKVVDTEMKSWNPVAVPNITTLIIGVSATLTPSSDPGIGGDTTFIQLSVAATGGNNYFTIASAKPGLNPIGTGFLEINLSDYGISGTLDYIGIASRIHWKGARAEWECFYLGIF